MEQNTLKKIKTVVFQITLLFLVINTSLYGVEADGFVKIYENGDPGLGLREVYVEEADTVLIKPANNAPSNDDRYATAYPYFWEDSQVTFRFYIEAIETAEYSFTPCITNFDHVTECGERVHAVGSTTTEFTIQMSRFKSHEIGALVRDVDGEPEGDRQGSLGFSLPERIIKRDGDIDLDGLTNAEEVARHTDLDVGDTDGDRLGDGEEILKYGTDPTVSDSDEDGLQDGEEIFKFETDPEEKDTDNDGFEDGEEIHQLETNPLAPNTDNDGNSGLQESQDAEERQSKRNTQPPQSTQKETRNLPSSSQSPFGVPTVLWETFQIVMAVAATITIYEFFIRTR